MLIVITLFNVLVGLRQAGKAKSAMSARPTLGQARSGSDVARAAPGTGRSPETSHRA
jgi:hypothetical protein